MEFGLILAKQVFVMFLLLLAGMILYKTHIITREGNKELTNVVLYLVAPFLILDTYQMEYDAALLKNMLLGFVLSFASILLGIAVSNVLRIGKGGHLATERFAVIFTNCGFMGIPLVGAVFGELGVFYATTYLTMFNLVVWTYGVVLMRGKAAGEKRRRSVKELLKPFLTPTMVCIVLGIGMYVLRFRFPKPVVSAIGYIASMNTPLAMLVSGVYIAQSDLGKALREKKVYVVTAVKCLLVPFVTLLFLWLLPIDFTLKMTVLIASACPTAANCMLFANRFGGEEAEASHIFTVTTLLCIITIPLMVMLAKLLWQM